MTPMEPITAQRGEDHARELIAKLVEECAEGVSDREAEAQKLAGL